MGRHQGMLMDRMIWRRLLIIVIESEQLFSMDLSPSVVLASSVLIADFTHGLSDDRSSQGSGGIESGGREDPRCVSSQPIATGHGDQVLPTCPAHQDDGLDGRRRHLPSFGLQFSAVLCKKRNMRVKI